MVNRKSIFFAAALALTAGAVSFAGPVAYKEAAAPWSAAQAVRLAPALTPEVIKAFSAEAGPAAASELLEKKEKVSALLKRFGACALRAEDVLSADRYLDSEFRAEVRYFAGRGCEEFKGSAAGGYAGPRAGSLAALENIAASGELTTYNGSARFFDGAASAQPVATPAAAGAVQRYNGQAPAAAKNIASKVPQPRSSEPPEVGTAGRPAGIGRDGRVNYAVRHWSEVRRENWAAYVKGDLEGAAKAKALLKAAAGAGFGGLLVFSNLPEVETAAAKLRWDIKNNSGSRIIAADAARFVFHSGVFVLALAPIPMLKVLSAAVGGEAWALVLVSGMAAGPINRYVLHLAD